MRTCLALFSSIAGAYLMLHC